MLVYQVVRVIKFVNDSVIKFPVGVYGHKEDAETAIMEVQQALAPVLKYDIVQTKGNSAFPIGVCVGQYLADLGVINFKHEIQPVEVSGKVNVIEPLITLS